MLLWEKSIRVVGMHYLPTRLPHGHNVYPIASSWG